MAPAKSNRKVGPMWHMYTTHLLCTMSSGKGQSAKDKGHKVQGKLFQSTPYIVYSTVGYSSSCCWENIRQPWQFRQRPGSRAIFGWLRTDDCVAPRVVRRGCKHIFLRGPPRV
jgi:hypothetical protein